MSRDMVRQRKNRRMQNIRGLVTVLILLLVCLTALLVIKNVYAQDQPPETPQAMSAVAKVGGCAVVYYRGGEFYSLRARQYEKRLGVDTIDLDVSQLVFGRFVLMYSDYTRPDKSVPENNYAPTVSYVNTATIQLFSLTYTYQGVDCRTWLPFAVN